MRLEPDAGKLARPVLRGGDGSNVVSLPDLGSARPVKTVAYLTARTDLTTLPPLLLIESIRAGVRISAQRDARRVHLE